MNNSELDHLLKSASVPEREAGYWEDFPQAVLRRLRSAAPVAGRPAAPRPRPVLAWCGLGLAAACLVLGFGLGFWKGSESAQEKAQLAAMRKYFHEVSDLFPNQVRAIVLERDSVRLILSDAPDVPNSPPIYVQACRGSHCQRFVTFSGEQIQINGDTFEVLAGSEQVILVGQHFVVSNEEPAPARSGWHIRAQTLESIL